MARHAEAWQSEAICPPFQDPKPSPFKPQARDSQPSHKVQGITSGALQLSQPELDGVQPNAASPDAAEATAHAGLLAAVSAATAAPTAVHSGDWAAALALAGRGALPVVVMLASWAAVAGAALPVAAAAALVACIAVTAAVIAAAARGRAFCHRHKGAWHARIRCVAAARWQQPRLLTSLCRSIGRTVCLWQGALSCIWTDRTNTTNRSDYC